MPNLYLTHMRLADAADRALLASHMDSALHTDLARANIVCAIGQEHDREQAHEAALDVIEAAIRDTHDMDVTDRNYAVNALNVILNAMFGEVGE